MQAARSLTTIFVILLTTLGSSSLSYGAEKAFGISAAISHSQSLNNYQDGTVTKTNDYELIPSYKWTSLTSILILTYSQDLRYPEKNDIGDLALKNIFKPHDFSRIQLIPSLTFVIPQSKESRENLNLEGAVSAKLEAAIQKKLLIPGLGLSAAISAGRSFHRYDTAASGAANFQHSSRQTLAASYEYQAMAVSAEFHHINKWTYAGTMTDVFEHAEEAAYAPVDFVSLIIGHTNAGSMLKANGIDSNFKLIDDNNSLVYAKVAIQY